MKSPGQASRPRAKPLRGTAAKTSSAKKQPVTQPIPEWAVPLLLNTARCATWEGRIDLRGPVTLQPDPHVVFGPSQMPNSPTWLKRIHPLDRHRVAAHFDRLYPEMLPSSIDYRILGYSNEPHWVRHRTVQLVPQGKTLVARSILQDIQGEKDFQMESLRVSEREQNRIGQDLHDDLCQVLAGVSCLMKLMETRLSKIAPSEIPTLHEINQQVIEAMQRTRALTHGLFPGKIQITDIRGALLELAEQIRTRFAIAVRPEFVGRFPKHSTAQVIQIFRIAQEAVSNAIKHGHATEVKIHLEAQPELMKLTLTDNGSGLSKGTAASSDGVGMHIMNYRASLLGGSVTLTNVKPNGVSVCLSYPFEA